MTRRKWLFGGLALSSALVLTVLVLAVASAAPDYLYVKPGGTGDCSSWTNACDLQTALTNAVYGDEIWVAAGTYTPTNVSGRSATFQMKAGVAIYGGFDGTENNRSERDWTANVTTLSGDIGTVGVVSDNAYHVVRSSSVTETAILDGFTVTGGNANGGPSDRNGGGMYNVSSSPSISNTTFYSNTAYYGGGIHNDNSDPALQNVTFTDNSVIRNGGGMHNDNGSDPTLNNVTFSGNYADEYGGGMHNDSSNPLIVNVTFEDNSAGLSGGGMSSDTSSPTVVNATFKDNMATFDGGGMFDTNSTSKVTNAVFVGNQASSDGGGMGCDSSSSSTVVNVTFYDNSATSQGGGLWSNGSSPSVSNSVFWSNAAATGAQIHTIGGSPSVSYSLVQGGYTGTGNVTGDPNFADAASDDFTLEPGSAAIDAGDNTAVLSDAADLDGDNNTAEPLPEDNAGADRFLDVAGTTNTGNGTAPIVDMGAYEASFVELSIIKEVNPSDAMPGQPVAYTLIFSNLGSLTAHGVVITDIVPTELTSRSVISSGISITDSGATPPYVWNVADLAPGAGGIIIISGKVDPTLKADTTMNNSAAIDTTDEDIAPANNSDSGSTSVTVPRIQLSSATYQVGESDGTATFTVTLDTANPYADATVQYTSSDGTATAGEDYTAVNSTQTVVSGTTSATFTVPITSDEVDESDETLTVTLSNPSGAMIDTPSSATLTIQDDDTAGTGVAPTSLTVSEPSGSDTFTITLDSEPTETVTIDLTSLDTTECSVPVSVTLDAGNWNTGVVVTVQAVNDDMDDGPQTCTVQTVASSADPYYDNIDIDDVTVTVQDDDTAGTNVDPTSLTVSEPSGSDTFTITLTSEPTATVTIDLTSFDTTECSVPVSVTLDAGNWNTGVVVTVQAVDDWVDDESQTCIVQTVASSDDPNYEGIDIDDVTVTVQDDDTAGNTVSPTSLTVSEPSGSDVFTITLSSEPTATVTISMTTSSTQCSAPASVVLDAGNWNTGVQVTVQAVDDDFNDGTQTCIVQTAAAESSDPKYDGMAVDDVTVDVEDEDEPGITVDPQALTVIEPNSTNAFNISLTSEPTATVTISMTTSNTECQILVDSIMLDGSNWDTGVDVTVQAVNDDLDDGAQTCVVQTEAAVSADPDYAGTDPADVIVSVQDDDGAGVIVDPTTVYVTEGGANDVYLLRLTSEPTATVTITVTTDGQTTVSPTSLTFNASNWSSPQIVTVQAVDNTIAEGNRIGTITHAIASDDPNYKPGAITISDVTVQITDNDSTPAVDFGNAHYAVGEGAGTATITVELSKPYSLTVTVEYATSNGTAVAGSDYVTATGTLTFTPGTTMQSFDVTITDDVLYDPDETIILNLDNAVNAAISGGNTPATLTITDNDKGCFLPLVLKAN